MRPRRLAFFASLALATQDLPARADEPDTALGVLTGASVFVLGFGAGATLLATSGEKNPSQDNAGWLTMESGFVVAPLVSHGVVGEWTRGLAFSAVPVGALGGSAGLFADRPRTVRHGVLSEQRVLWALFGAALFTGAAGVVDVAFAGERAHSLTIAPAVGAGRYGLEVGGTL